MHLNAEELVDLAEGARAESSAPHLAACARCRAQLDELRAMMTAVASADVPEPSPLFWDHFSQRVHDAAAAEKGDARSKAVRATARLAEALTARRLQASVVAVAAAALVVLVVLPSRVLSPDNPLQPGGDAAQRPVADAAPRDLWADAAPDIDPSLTLVASLTATLDADATSETGLAGVGSAEHAVTHMNDADLRELHRLLQEEMAP